LAQAEEHVRHAKAIPYIRRLQTARRAEPSPFLRRRRVDVEPGPPLEPGTRVSLGMISTCSGTRSAASTETATCGRSDLNGGDSSAGRAACNTDSARAQGFRTRGARLLEPRAVRFGSSHVSNATRGVRRERDDVRVLLINAPAVAQLLVDDVAEDTALLTSKWRHCALDFLAHEVGHDREADELRMRMLERAPPPPRDS